MAGRSRPQLGGNGDIAANGTAKMAGFGDCLFYVRRKRPAHILRWPGRPVVRNNNGSVRAETRTRASFYGKNKWPQGKGKPLRPLGYRNCAPAIIGRP